jgi:hypothetical protein
LKRSNPLGNASLAKKLKVESGESVSGISKTIKQNLSVGAENSHNVGQVSQCRIFDEVVLLLLFYGLQA